MVRGLRGATTVVKNEAKEIVDASYELFLKLVEDNALEPSDIAQVLITVTNDISADFPAKALRKLKGFEYVPVMCAKEMEVPESLPLCIRFMLTINTDKSQLEMNHVYLNKAIFLRPDLVLTKNDDSR